MLAQNTLPGLPVEPQLDIINRLPYLETALLRSTCVYFHGLLNHARISDVDLLEVRGSEFARKRRLFACFQCMRLRRTIKFADNMLRGKTTRNHYGASQRFCIDCGTRDGARQCPWGMRRTRDKLPNHYFPGSLVRVQSVRMVYCMYCGEFRKSSKKDQFCVKCWEYWEVCQNLSGMPLLTSNKRCMIRMLHYGPPTVDPLVDHRPADIFIATDSVSVVSVGYFAVLWTKNM